MSRIMNKTRNASGGGRFAAMSTRAGVRALVILCTMMAVVKYSTAQSLYLETGGTWSGSGVIKVKDSVRNVSSSAATVATTVELNASANQVIGKAGDNAITFKRLVTSGTSSKTIGVAVTVAESLGVGNSTTLVVGTSTLNIDSLAGVGGTGTFNPSGAGTVNYRQAGGTQNVLTGSYGGTLGLSGAAAKQFAGAVTTATLNHTGGGLTVNQDVTVTGAAAIATLTNVSATKTLALGASASTIATMSGNSGSITGGAGTVAFTNAAANSGDITGGSGAVTFSNTLSTSAGTVTSGSGGLNFNGALSVASGTVTAPTGGSLSFSSTVNNAGTVSLTGTGVATVSGNITNTGTLSFAPGSSVTYSGTALRIPAATYGNMTIAGSGTDTAIGAVTVAGNLVLNNDLRMASAGDSLIFTSAASTVTGSNEVIGKVTRSHTFAAATAYSFNRDSVTLKFASDPGTPVTIGMYPGTAPSAPPTPSYINRKYTFASAANLAAHNADVRLYYKDSDIIGSLTESKLAFRKFDGTSWSQYSTGSYTRTVTGTGNSILFSTITEGFGGVQEIGLFPTQIINIASGPFSAGGTWAAGIIPTSADDILIKHAVTVAATDTVDNVTIDDTTGASLAINAGTFRASGLMNYKSLSIAAGATLQLTSTLTNTSGGTVAVSGTGALASVTNIGSFSIAGTGSVTSTGFANATGSTLTNATNGSLTVSAGNFRNAGAVSNDGVITVQ